ncbi:MAG TPA: phosphate ABC transporter permease PstA [Chromatiales bacterium]|nr:phosphate ABC transporter permease PstA [Thiotrichales bacterium]HIP68648.1 phosphate ABC transporter permease PstA [Chromatiales bacterium]
MSSRYTLCVNTVNNMNNTELIKKGLAKRYRREKRFRAYGLMAVMVGFIFLAILLADIIGKAIPAFTQHWIKLEVSFDPDTLGIDEKSDEATIRDANFNAAVKKSIRSLFPEVKKRKDKRKLAAMLSTSAEYQIRDQFLADPEILGQTKTVWVLADDDVDTYYKTADKSKAVRLSDKQIAWADKLLADGLVKKRLNTTLFKNGDSREPEQAGIRGAIKGSFYTLLVTFLLSFPLGVATAVYLEEFAPKNRWVDLIEVNINNLAAVPSIVFGLLGLAVFINYFGLPRSAPLVGGLVLTLMTLPTIIIASRSAIKAVPPSIKEAALGIGASKTQMVFQHVLPLAMPGIFTGTIIGLAQALGETAPLLMIGMVAFIVDIPQGFTDSATVLPVQIYLWADSPERAFVARTSAAILALLVFLVVMNTLAVWLRKKFERRW